MTINLEHDGFNIEARWCGRITAEQKKNLKKWISRWSSKAKIDLKLGKERNRIAVNFDKHELEKQARTQILKISSMMQTEPELMDAAQVVENFANAQFNQVEMELVNSYLIVLNREWSQAATNELIVLFPPHCQLTIKPGKNTSEDKTFTR